MNLESKKGLVDIETKREILKHIKEGKLFPKFYLCCAEAFYRNVSPKDSLDYYLGRTVKYYLDKGTIDDEFVSGISSWLSPTKAIVMP